MSALSSATVNRRWGSKMLVKAALQVPRAPASSELARGAVAGQRRGRGSPRGGHERVAPPCDPLPKQNHQIHAAFALRRERMIQSGFWVSTALCAGSPRFRMSAQIGVRAPSFACGRQRARRPRPPDAMPGPSYAGQLETEWASALARSRLLGVRSRAQVPDLWIRSDARPSSAISPFGRAVSSVRRRRAKE